MSDIFLRAARAKLRFQSTVGPLTTEDLFDLPISRAVGNKPSLEAVGNALLQAQREIPEESILSTEPTNPARAKVNLAIEIVKFVIAVKQHEAATAAARLAKKQEADRLREIIAARKATETPVEDLEKQLAALEA